ncbi:hypothetical protein Nepgr_033925 [Nepenthes gracilis]|uniref:Uncharacterized protein n=1 Tax=Nepenthes gracilis TaxID=150966 RepID=A0AAD3TMP4_NEPGR|nr:hypothetical protein Nepgr_033925 [Nepenthes gracilis]
MQKERQIRDTRDPFDIFGSFVICAAHPRFLQQRNQLSKTDDEGEGEIVGGNIDDHQRRSSSSKEPFVDHPDDKVDGAHGRVERCRLKNRSSNTSDFQGNK